MKYLKGLVYFLISSLIVLLGVMFLYAHFAASNRQDYDLAVKERQKEDSSFDLKEKVDSLLSGDIKSESSNENGEIVEEKLQDEGFSNERYYYKQLNDEEKHIYREVYHAITTHSAVKVSTLSEELLEKIFNCVEHDYPELFYISGYAYSKATRKDKAIYLEFEACYIYSEEEANQMQIRIDQATSEILSNAPINGTDYDKVKFVYDYLVNNTSYNSQAKDNQQITSVLLYHESVCSGYAKATQYLLNKIGVESTLVIGKANNESHAWNLVLADGSWYYLDTTWGDADFQDSYGSSSMKERPINYDYFMVDSSLIGNTHVSDKTVPLPECFAKDCNYYIHEDLYLTGLDVEKISTFFENGYARGDHFVQFKCSNGAVYLDVFRYLIDDGHAFDMVQADDSISYTANKETNTFCFWLCK